MTRHGRGSGAKRGQSQAAFALLLAAMSAGGFALVRWRHETHAEMSARPVATTPVAAEAAPSTPGLEKSIRQPIRDALAGDDPFASAGKMLAWLETARAETFRKLAEEPEKFPTAHFSGFDSDFRNAYFTAITERWLALDPGGALPAMQRVEEALEKKNQEPQFLFALAQLRPGLVLEKLPLTNTQGYFERYVFTAVGELAQRDLPAAQHFTATVSDAKMRALLDDTIIRGIAESDPLAAVALAAKSENETIYSHILEAAEKAGPGMVRQVLQAAGERLGPYAISPNFILRHPELATDLPKLPVPKGGFHLNAEAMAQADRLAPEERARLLENFDALPPAARDGAAAALASSWARTEPRQAAEWALAHSHTDHGASPANEAAQQVFLRWINNDAASALNWWRALPASALRDALGTNASTFLAEAGELDAALGIFHPSPAAVSPKDAEALRAGGSSLDGQATTQLAQFFVRRDPAAAGAWFATLPPGAISYQSAQAIVEPWYARSPEAVARWLETLPAGAVRDQATRVFIESAARQSPAGFLPARIAMRICSALYPALAPFRSQRRSSPRSCKSGAPQCAAKVSVT